jgi:NAD-specific glutamate dehydrogenase
VLNRDTEDRGAEDGDPETLIEAWLADNRSSVERTRAILSDLKEAETLDIAMLSVGLREIRNLSETGSALADTPPPG